MIKVKTLTFSNIGRFVGQNTVDFSSKPNLIQVDAQNKNTGGSSGGGKTTLFLAIEYVLGINDTPATVLQSRLTKVPMEVSICIDDNGKEYVITRNKKEGLSISGNAAAEGSNALSEEALDKILGIPRNLIRPMIHKRQKEGGFFLNKTPQQAHSFLMECLSMKSLESKAEKAGVDVLSKERVLEMERSTLASIEASLSSHRGFLTSLCSPKCSVDESSIERTKTYLDQLSCFLSKLEAEFQKETSELKPPVPPMVTADPEIVDKINKSEVFLSNLRDELNQNTCSKLSLSQQISTLSNALLQFNRDLKTRPSLEADLISLKTQISKTMEKLCPTCKQDIRSEETSSNLLNDLISKAQVVKNSLDRLSSIESQIPSLSTDLERKNLEMKELENKTQTVGLNIKQIEKAISDLRSSAHVKTKEAMEAYNAELIEFNTAKLSLEKKWKEEISEARLRKEEVNREYASSLSEFAAYKTALNTYNHQSSALQAKIYQLEQELSEKLRICSIKETELKVTKDAFRLCKSYANQLFQDSLAIVAVTASKILSQIPNMETATITFDAFKENKNGTLKEEVTAILSMEGEVGVPIKSISGGERTAIDLAIDLAVIDMIESKTGKGIDLLFLDELFDGLDAICRERCLQVLQTHTSSRKIVIVDHSSETKAMVQDKILIIRDGQTSSVSDSIQ